VAGDVEVRNGQAESNGGCNGCFAGRGRVFIIRASYGELRLCPTELRLCPTCASLLVGALRDHGVRGAKRGESK
jgi:hypothetical protein